MNLTDARNSLGGIVSLPRCASIISLLLCLVGSAEDCDCGSTGAPSPPPQSAPEPTPDADPAPNDNDGPGNDSPGNDSPGNDSPGNVPGDVLDLDNWYLTLPTGAKGDPDTIEQPELASYRSSHFRLNKAKDGVVFTTPADGVTTKNSAYPRSELREMSGPTKKASWSNTSGTHTLSTRQAVTELPKAKPELVTAQIHGGDDDVMQVRLEGTRLMVQYDDGGKEIVIDPKYRLGTVFDVRIVAAEGRVEVFYNGTRKAQIEESGSGWYFKSGSYLQSNTSKGDEADATGVVVVYSLEVTHSR